VQSISKRITCTKYTKNWPMKPCKIMIKEM
jgi:hypothetical protein